ncbi:MAG TPA: fibronectin type III domain-containing protein [Candidatus Udaeobacter sp.]|jgi:hypothetical protein|nr:fibronectin type III domain-containing protein [Candidatus Udaeobacter sp.]
MRKLWILMMVSAVFLAGCDDQTSPQDRTPPAAPRGVYSVTGDQSVTLHWLQNTEGDLALYRVYIGNTANGAYTRVGSTPATSFTITGLTDGVTKYFAVSAVDLAGNESDLSYDTIHDTPRPAGTNQGLSDKTSSPSTSGWDFSAFTVRPWDDPSTDMYYQLVGGTPQMVCPFTDTDIQDAGYATSLDAVDFAPSAGWSSTGTVELIAGHCYVLRLGATTVNYAKFRVISISSSQVVFDWAYQTDPNNRELRARPAGEDGARTRRTAASLAAGAVGSR